MADETNVQSTETTAIEQEKTFTQADVDALIQKRLERERKKFPNDEEMTAYRTWKDNQQTEQERWNKLQGERDTLSGKLTAAEGERDNLKRELYVLKKGLSGDEAEFIAFKAGKMVDDNTTFEQAVDALTAERRKTTFDWTAPVGEGTPQAIYLNERINKELRGH